MSNTKPVFTVRSTPHLSAFNSLRKPGVGKEQVACGDFQSLITCLYSLLPQSASSCKKRTVEDPRCLTCNWALPSQSLAAMHWRAGHPQVHSSVDGQMEHHKTCSVTWQVSLSWWIPNVCSCSRLLLFNPVVRWEHQIHCRYKIHRHLILKAPKLGLKPQGVDSPVLPFVSEQV